MWPLVPAFYPMLPFGAQGNVGVLSTWEPWSGHFEYSSTVAACAHMTQFTAPRGACTFVPNHAIGADRDGHVGGTNRSVIATAFDCGELGWTLVISPLSGLYSGSKMLTVRLDE